MIQINDRNRLTINTFKSIVVVLNFNIILIQNVNFSSFHEHDLTFFLIHNFVSSKADKVLDGEDEENGIIIIVIVRRINWIGQVFNGALEVEIETVD